MNFRKDKSEAKPKYTLALKDSDLYRVVNQLQENFIKVLVCLIESKRVLISKYFTEHILNYTGMTKRNTSPKFYCIATNFASADVSAWDFSSF